LKVNKNVKFNFTSSIFVQIFFLFMRTFKKHNITKGLPLIIFFGLIITSFQAFSQQHTFSSFSPSHAGTGDIVTIRGTNFTGVTAVRFGGTNASSYTVVNATTILAVVGAGTSGSVTVLKTGFNTQSRTGFVYSALPTVTEIITDYGSFWRTSTTTNSPIWPDNSHNLLSFSYKNVTYSTGVDDGKLISNGITYTAGSFKALPVELQGTTKGGDNLIMTGSKLDGNSTTAILTHPAIKDLTMQKSVIDGVRGLDLGTGYTNLPTGASSNYYITNINPTKITDDEPDILVTQIAEPTGTATDTYVFLDASNNVIGNSVQVSLANLSALGTYRLDLYSVAAGQPFSIGKPNAIWQTNSTRQIRFVAFRLSDFGINATNYTQVKTLRITPSGVSDVAFVAYNANALDALPVVQIDVTTTNTVVCDGFGGPAQMGITASSPSGDPLAFRWQESLDNGITWNDVFDGGIYNGATTQVMQLTDGTPGVKYRTKVTATISGYIIYSPEFTITGVTGSALAGTLNPTGFTNCLNAITGTTTLSVAPTGGTGTYTYIWESSAVSGGPYIVIPGAVTNTYTPDFSTAGTTYYRVRIVSGCYNHTSTESVVTINGHTITSVTDGSRCNTGTVALSATASGGTINWFNVASGGSSLTSGNNYTTPSISSTREYYVSTTVAGCISPRVPVNAIIASGTVLNSTNFEIIFSSDVCAGSGSSVSLASSNLVNGHYTVNYTVSGDNNFSSSSTITFNDGYASFLTDVLNNTGVNTLTINSFVIGGCIINVSSGNTSTINVFSGIPNIVDLNVTVTDGCSNIPSVATVTSTSLANGTYVVAYAVTGTNSLSTSSQVAFVGGNGSFSLPLLLNVGTSNVLTIQSISLLSSPTCIGYPDLASNAFASNAETTLNSGSDINMCTSETSANITAGSSSTNFTSLSWSTSGSGSFTDNNTANALTNTIYTPSAADKTAGSVVLTLTATANSGCQNQNRAITFYINPLSVGGTISGGGTVCTGSNTSTLTLTGNTGAVTRWEWSALSDFSSGVNTVSNTTSSLTVDNLTANRFYRAVITSGSCSSALSANANITVSPTSIGGNLTGNATVCSGTNSTTFTLSEHTGNVTRWEWSAISDFSSGVNNVANTSTTLTATNLSSTRHYRAVVTSGACASANSSIGTVTVNPVSVAGSINGDAAACSVENSTPLTLTGHTGNIQWQSSTNNSTFNNIVGETASTYTASNLTATTYYRAVVTSGVCSPATSSSFTLTIVPPSISDPSLASGDFVWRGSDANSTDSVDWLVPTNWYVYDGENYSVAATLPTKEINVFIPGVGACFKANPHIFTNETPESKNLTILSNGHLTMHTGKLSVAGNWVNNGLFTAGSGEVIFIEKGYITIGGSVSVNAFHDFRMNKAKDGSILSVAYLLKQATISGQLTLTHGAFDINEFSIDMDDRAVNGGNHNSYVRTSDDGFLRRYVGSAYSNMQAGFVQFPVGRTRYNPCWLNNSGTSDKFSVRLFDKVTDDSREESSNTSLPAVERTWMIEEETIGGSDVQMRLYWNGTFAERIEEINGFDYSKAYIAHYDADIKNSWENKGGNAPSGPGYALQSGITSFSPFTISSEGGLGWESPLPVVLLDFSAQCLDDKTVQVSWQTASEHNASHYLLNKSYDAVTWRNIESIPAAGHSTSLLNYGFLDREIQNGNNYYQLVQYDFDGKYEVFPLTYANCIDELKQNELLVFPNPSEQVMYIDYNSSSDYGLSDIKIMDTKGSIVYTLKVNIQHGVNFFTLTDMSLQTGVYYISIENDSFRTNVVKQLVR
jgi:hypothetical protein